MVHRADLSLAVEVPVDLFKLGEAKSGLRVRYVCKVVWIGRGRRRAIRRRRQRSRSARRSRRMWRSTEKPRWCRVK